LNSTCHIFFFSFSTCYIILFYTFFLFFFISIFFMLYHFRAKKLVACLEGTLSNHISYGILHLVSSQTTIVFLLLQFYVLSKPKEPDKFTLHTLQKNYKQIQLIIKIMFYPIEQLFKVNFNVNLSKNKHSTSKVENFEKKTTLTGSPPHPIRFWLRTQR